MIKNETMADKLKNVIETDDIRFFTSVKKVNDDISEVILTDVMNSLVNDWNNYNDEQKEQISKLLLEDKPKYYLGDIKYVLYQYVCDMNTYDITFRCGSYAFNKIAKMSGYEDNKKDCLDGLAGFGLLNLNGELILVGQMSDIPKKQMIISKDFKFSEGYNSKIYPDDIVLEFA